MGSYQEFDIISSERLRPSKLSLSEQAFPLSLLDATAADFGLTSAFWCFEGPLQSSNTASFAFVSHLRESLIQTLNSYPHWCGHVLSIKSTDGSVPPEAQHFPPHSRRFGRVYVHHRTPTDPGVDFVMAKSSWTLDQLHPHTRPSKQPIWDRSYSTDPFVNFLPSAKIRKPLQPYEIDETGVYPAAFAIRLTQLACGGYVVAASLTHSLGDITALVQFVRDWAQVSRAMFAGNEIPPLKPGIDPSKVDAAAAGDINSAQPDSAILEQTKILPLARYDWWAESAPQPGSEEPTAVFQGRNIPLAGDMMPWKDWDVSAPVSNYTIHLSRDQVDWLWAQANKIDEDDMATTTNRHQQSKEYRNNKSQQQRISRHDAILAHLWSCITRARRLSADDDGLVHCCPSLGLRPALHLGAAFIGSPILMIDLKLPASLVAATTDPNAQRIIGNEKSSLRTIAHYIRATISSVNNNPDRIAAHLHSVAFESSPQRIWNGFLGRRHTMVTTWARAGLYDVDFFGSGDDAGGTTKSDGSSSLSSSSSSPLRYADGIMPRVDGCILVKEGPPTYGTNKSPSAWTDNGVDIAVAMKSEDMERLLSDPALFPPVVTSTA